MLKLINFWIKAIGFVICCNILFGYSVAFLNGWLPLFFAFAWLCSAAYWVLWQIDFLIMAWLLEEDEDDNG